MNNTTNYPQKTGIDFILKDAFRYWSNSLVYQILFSLIYFSVFVIVSYYFSAKYGILDQYLATMVDLKGDFSALPKAMAEIQANPNYSKFSWIIIGTMVFLYPLNLGLYKIFRKMDLKEALQTEDLFAGYAGSNFFMYTSFFLFWYIIYSYTVPTIFLGIIWVFITLFSAPLMFFMEKRTFETIELTFKAIKMYPLEIFVCAFVAFAFRYFGIITLIGAVFTFPFWNAMIYALYKKVFKELD